MKGPVEKTYGGVRQPIGGVVKVPLNRHYRRKLASHKARETKVLGEADLVKPEGLKEESV